MVAVDVVGRATVKAGPTNSPKTAKSRLKAERCGKEAAPKGGPSQGGNAQGGLQHRTTCSMLRCRVYAAVHNKARAQPARARMAAMQLSRTARAHEAEFLDGGEGPRCKGQARG